MLSYKSGTNSSTRLNTMSERWKNRKIQIQNNNINRMKIEEKSHFKELVSWLNISANWLQVVIKLMSK